MTASDTHPQAGFTLLEVLVGLVIASLILSGLSLAMATVNRGYEQMGQAIDRQGTIATGLGIFGEDISRIARLPEDPSQPQRFLFLGREREMIYVLDERPGSNEAGIYWVRLQVRSGTGGDVLVRERAPFVRPADMAAVDWTDAVVLIEGQQTLTFAYRAPRAGLRDWAAGWDATNMLPSQIKIDVVDAATGRARVPSYTATLKVTAETDCADAAAPGCTVRSDGAYAGEQK